MTEKPNILLIFTDQQRWDAMGAYGNTIIKTPNMDRLAAEGAIFTNAITPCPICVPARACAMTGYAAGRNTIMNNGGSVPVGSNRDTVPGILGKSGYFCQAIGKMHFTPDGETYGMDHLILSEEMRSTRFAKDAKSQWYDDYDKYLIDKGLWGWEKPPEIGYNEIKPLINNIPKEHHITQWCGDRTVEWLKEDRPKDKPFFLFSSFVKPHVPYDCPAHLVDLYNPDEMPLPWRSGKESNRENLVYAASRKNQEWDLYSDDAAKRAKAYYYANITFIDEQVGRILDELENQGLAENTLVVFTADHGDMMGDHDLWYKSFGYEGSIHIPMMARWPGKIKPGTRVDELSGLLDLFPTFMAAAEVDSSVDRPGSNLMELLEGKQNREMIFSEINNNGYCIYVRHKNWKYIFFQNGGYEELYNLANDPKELEDLAGDTKNRETLDCLRKAAEEWIARYSNGNKYLDENGHLKKHPYAGETDLTKVYNRQARPYSRMPWDSRIPVSLLNKNQLNEMTTPWWWKEVGGDWSQLVEYAKNKNR